MLKTIFTRLHNGFMILYQAFVLIHEHKAFYWFASLLMFSYAAIIGVIGSCFLYLIKSTSWTERIQTTTHVAHGTTTYSSAYQGTMDPFVFMSFMSMLIIALMAHALWSTLLEIAISFYSAAAMHHDYANLHIRKAIWRSLTTSWRVVCWVLLNMTVGFIIGALRGHSNNKKNFSILDALRQMLGSLLSMAWSICTFLVPQVIAFEGTGAILSIKTSFEIIKKTFGESLSANFIFSAFYSAISMLVVLIGFLLSRFIYYDASGTMHVPLIVSIAFGALVCSAAFAIALVSVARMIFKTSIYFYAKNNECVGFDASLITQSFR